MQGTPRYLGIAEPPFSSPPREKREYPPKRRARSRAHLLPFMAPQRGGGVTRCHCCVVEHLADVYTANCESLEFGIWGLGRFLVQSRMSKPLTPNPQSFKPQGKTQMEGKGEGGREGGREKAQEEGIEAGLEVGDHPPILCAALYAHFQQRTHALVTHHQLRGLLVRRGCVDLRRAAVNAESDTDDGDLPLTGWPLGGDDEGNPVCFYAAGVQQALEDFVLHRGD